MVDKTYLIGLHQDSGFYFESASTYTVLAPKSIEQQGTSFSLQSKNVTSPGVAWLFLYMCMS